MVKEGYIIRIGPKLKKVLDMQKKIIRELTYDVCNSSDYEAGEIIADKILKSNIM